MQRTLATLLQIARAEAAGVTTHGDAVDLAALAANMVELYAPGMRAAGLEVTLDAPTPAPLTGNRQLLAQLITNLLENALKYVPAGGHVWVRVRNMPDGISLSVSDDGPGAPRIAPRRYGPSVRVGDAATMPPAADWASLAAAGRDASRSTFAGRQHARLDSALRVSRCHPARRVWRRRTGLLRRRLDGVRRVAPGAAWKGARS